MSAKSNNFKLGLFILAAVILFVLGVIILGSGSLGKPKHTMETYFDTSVQGIDIGSKVKFRGVTIGEVTAIDFTTTRYNSPYSYVLVEMAITKSIADNPVDLEKEIKKGLRARMSAQGITGVFFIEFDYMDPDRAPVLLTDWKPAHPYIPSAGTSLQRIINSLEEFLAHVEKVDFARFINSSEKLVNTANTLALTANATLSQIPAQKLGDEAALLLTELRSTNQRLQTILNNPDTEKAIGNISTAADSIRRQFESPQLADTLAKLNSAANQADQLLAGKDTQIDILLENLRKTTDNLRNLSEDIEQNPSRLLRGAQPPKEK